MEQRVNVRVPVELTARLIREGRVIATAQVVNVSPDGLGVEILYMDLKMGQKVDVEFIKPGHPRDISCWVPAMEVVHTSPKTVGLLASHDTNSLMLSPDHCVKSIIPDDQGVSHGRPATP